MIEVIFKIVQYDVIMVTSLNRRDKCNVII